MKKFGLILTILCFAGSLTVKAIAENGPSNKVVGTNKVANSNKVITINKTISPTSKRLSLPKKQRVEKRNCLYRVDSHCRYILLDFLHIIKDAIDNDGTISDTASKK